MRTLTLRAVLSCLLTVVLAGSLFARDSSAARLYTSGPAWLNRSNVPKTSAMSAAPLGGLKFVPAARLWTEFEVRDTDGSVKIIARKSDLTPSDANGTTTLAQAQESTRDETSANGKKKRDRNMGGAVPAAGGGILDSPPAIYGGLAAIGALTGWTLTQGDDPMNPK